jgi:hypothetical protein
MDRKRFLEWVAASSWRVAKSSPHSYTIRFWHSDRRAFEEAVRFVREQGTPGYWNGTLFYYYRPGDGWRYWTYWDDDPATLGGVVCFNRARESGQMRLWSD